uniref:Putative vesicle transport through interaction with t-snares protein 1b n=1 Tax=Tabanus bromius TaxID=304241 RepID=A0A0K8TP58_TABBR
MSNIQWDESSHLIVVETRHVLDRTSHSLARSNQVAAETEQIGTEVLSELGEQRQSLLRSQNRLENANDGLSKSRAALNAIGRNVLYNKIILILIILLEIGILAGLIYIKFIMKH